MTDEDLLRRPAVELAALLRRRALSARELLDATLARHAALDAGLNAVPTLDEVRARATAAALDQAMVTTGPVGPLHGLPIVHKDLLPTAGLRTTFGSPLFAAHVPASDHLLAQRTRTAGAVRLGKSNVPEFGAGSQTTNPVFGATRNPWDATRTPGGSSGGAAVALATGMAALADGSDMGGSLRNPASFCGVVGLRPSVGRVPDVPVRDAGYDLSVLGPMGRTVADCALLLSAIAGPDPRDPRSLLPPLDLGTLDRDLTGVTVAWGGDLGLPYDAAVLAAYEAVRPLVASLGVRLVDAAPDVTGADEVFRVLRGWYMAGAFGGLDDALLGQNVRTNVAYGRTVTAEDLTRAHLRRTQLVVATAEFLQQHDYLLLPVSQVLPFDADVLWPRTVGDEQQPDYLGWMRSAYLVSVLRVPCASVPAGLAQGLPVGLQVVGRHGDDAGVLQVAAALERVLPPQGRAATMPLALPQPLPTPSATATAATAAESRPSP